MLVPLWRSRKSSALRSLPITLRPSRKELLFHLTTSIVLTFGGFLGLKDSVLMGSFCILFFSTCAIIFLVQLCTKASYLRLDYEGFTICHLGKRQTISWQSVREFVPMKGANASVGWWYEPNYLSKSSAHFSRALIGVDGMLSDTYGMRPEQLAALMNELRLSYQLATFIQTQES